MDHEEAAELIVQMHPETAIPTHYGSFVGGKDAGKRFKERIPEDIKVRLLLDDETV